TAACPSRSISASTCKSFKPGAGRESLGTRHPSFYASRGLGLHASSFRSPLWSLTVLIPPRLAKQKIAAKKQSSPPHHRHRPGPTQLRPLRLCISLPSPSPRDQTPSRAFFSPSFVSLSLAFVGGGMSSPSDS